MEKEEFILGWEETFFKTAKKGHDKKYLLIHIAW